MPPPRSPLQPLAPDIFKLDKATVISEGGPRWLKYSCYISSTLHLSTYRVHFFHKI